MIATFISKARNSLVVKNSASLLMLQIGSYFVPLIVTPYLARILGIEAFGAFAIALGVAAYLSVVVEWGFPLSGPRDVAMNRDNPEKLRRLFWSVTYARGLLALISLAAFCAAAPFWGLQHHIWLCLAAAFQIIAIIPSSGWLLNGLENMMKPGTYGLVVRVLTVPATLLLVKSPADIVMAVAIQSAGAVGGSLVGLWYAQKELRIFNSPHFSFGDSLRELRNSSILFVSMGSMSLFTYANVIILGAMTGLTQAAVFNGAHRIMRAGQTILSPLSNAFYPRINHLMTRDMAAARRSMMTLFIAQVGAGAALSLVVAIAAPLVVAILLGHEFAASVPVLQIMCAIMFVSSVSNTLGTNMLLPMGLKSTFAVILLISGILNLILLALFIPIGGPIGAACAMLVTECVIVASKAVMVYRHRGRLQPAAPI